MRYPRTMSSPLVSAAWLLEHAAQVCILDARFQLGKPNAGREAFEAGHIPGARFIDLEKDLSAPIRPDRIGGRHPLASPDHIAAALSHLGASNSDHIVTYDDPSTGAGFYAPHLWWVLRYLGHDAVSVLDGGLPAWIAVGGTLESGAPQLTSATFTAHPRPEMLATAHDVETRAAEAVLIDSRAPERYRGDVEPLDWKAGHIPGAINRNWAEGMADGLWKSPAAQRERFSDVSSREIIVSCGSGVSAGGNMLALELAGIHGARLYHGSWSDWISDPARPIETGD